jgi:probable F420-dependent oxidoreductase
VSWQPDPHGVHVGVVLPTREALMVGAEIVGEVAARAESLGFDSLWAGDSLLARPLIDPLTALTVAAARTTSVRLGTGVLLAPLHQPVLMARAIASLDQVSAGRVIVGVGRGFDLPETRREFAAAGVDFDSRTRRLVDTVRLWRALWDESTKPVSARGSAWELEGVQLVPRPAQPGGPPIWLAGYGPVSFCRVAELADGWLPYPPTTDAYREGRDAIAAHAAFLGRSVTPAVMLTVNIDEDEAAAQANLAEYIQTFYGYPREIVGSLQGMAAGNPGDVTDAVTAYVDAGARAFVLRLASIRTPVQQLERAAEVLLPALRARRAESGAPQTNRGGSS